MKLLNWIEFRNGLIIEMYWPLSLTLPSYCIKALKELNELLHEQMTIPTSVDGFLGVSELRGDASCS